MLVTYELPDDQVPVVNAAVEMIAETMRQGIVSNGEGTWVNREALDYHARKSLLHICALWHDQDIESRERDAPHLRHLFNAVTRLSMAWANYKRDKSVKFTPDIEEHAE